MPRLHVDSTVEIDPATQTWQTNALRFPPKSKGGARASIALQSMPQGKIFSAAWKGDVGVRIEPGCGMYSLRFMTDGDFRYSDGRQTFCSERNLFIPPDQPFGGTFRDIRLLFVDLSPAVVERTLGGPLRGGVGIRALSRRQGAGLRDLAFRSGRQAEGLPADLRATFLRNFQNLMACALGALLREIIPDGSRPDPMIGRRRVADLRGKTPRTGQGLAVLFVDFDKFKTINDVHGHAAGDEVLRVTADRIRACLRHDDDLGARVGGDEMMVVLHGVHGIKDAATVADKLRRSAAVPVRFNSHSIEATVSVDVALAHEGESTANLVARADEAMYRAKQKGRNQVITINGGDGLRESAATTHSGFRSQPSACSPLPAPCSTLLHKQLGNTPYR